MVTIKEIAARTGFSTATVSRLLNDDPTFSVSSQTKKKILGVAKSLGYQHQRKGNSTNHNISLLYSISPQKEISDIFYNDLRNSIIEFAAKIGMTLSFVRHANEIPENSDGFIAVGYYDQQEIEQLKQLSIHGVFLEYNPSYHDFDSIKFNFQQIVKEAIVLFINNHFHSIGFIGGPSWSSNLKPHNHDDVRTQYFEYYTKRAGVFDDQAIFIGDSFSVSSGFTLGKQIIKQYSGKPLPEGFLVATDPLAVGVLQAFNESRIVVPDDTTLISINDNDIAKYVSPPLTSFHLDVNQLGSSSVNFLQQVIDTPNRQPTTILLGAELVYRKSFPKPS